MQAQVEIATGHVMATGTFPAGAADPSVEVVTLTPAQEAVVLSDEPGQRTLNEDGTVTITPPEPPPVRRAGTTTVDAVDRTSGDAPLEVFRFPTAPTHVYRATLGMTAIDASSGATRDSEVRLVFKRPAGAPEQVGATTVLSNVQDTAAASWRITPTIDGTDLVISVQGASGRSIDWALAGTIGAFAPEGLD